MRTSLPFQGWKLATAPRAQCTVSRLFKDRSQLWNPLPLWALCRLATPSTRHQPAYSKLQSPYPLTPPVLPSTPQLLRPTLVRPRPIQIYMPQISTGILSNGISFFVASAGLSYSSYVSSGYTSTPSYFQPAQLAPPQAQPQPPLQQPQQPHRHHCRRNNLQNSTPTPPGATLEVARSPAIPSTHTRNLFSTRARSKSPKGRPNSHSCTIAISAR